MVPAFVHETKDELAILFRMTLEEHRYTHGVPACWARESNASCTTTGDAVIHLEVVDVIDPKCRVHELELRLSIHVRSILPRMLDVLQSLERLVALEATSVHVLAHERVVNCDVTYVGQIVAELAWWFEVPASGLVGKRITHVFWCL